MLMVDFVRKHTSNTPYNGKCTKILRIDHGKRSYKGRRLLNHNRRGCHNGALFEKSDHLLCNILTGICHYTAVKISVELIDICSCSSSVGILNCLVNGFAVLSLNVRRLIVVHSAEVFQRKHKRMVVAHVIDMTRPYIHKAGQHNRVAGIGSCGLCEAGISQADLALFPLQICLSCFFYKLSSRSEREVKLFLEQIDSVHLHRNLVSLVAHGSRQITLHFINECFLVGIEGTHNVRKSFNRNLVCSCVLDQICPSDAVLGFGNFRLSIKHDATLQQMVMCLGSLGVCIKAHNLLQVQTELKASGRLERILLIHIPAFAVVLIVHGPSEFVGLHHIQRPHILSFADISVKLCKCGGTNAFKCVDRLQVIPRERIKELASLADVLLGFNRILQFEQDASCQIVSGDVTAKYKHLICITHSLKHHGIGIIDHS